MATMQKQERHVMIEWGDVKQRFLSVVGEGKPWPGVNSQHHTAQEMVKAGRENPYGPPKCRHSCKVAKLVEGERNCKHQHLWQETKYNPETKRYDYITHQPCAYCIWSGRERSWTGGSYGDTLDNLRNGYGAEEFIHSAAYVPMSPRKRPTWHEEPEGDLDISRLYGGYDDAYLVHAEQHKKPGIRVMIEFAFAAGVPNKVIEQYGAWVAGLLGALEASGYDLMVDMWIPLDGLFQNDEGEDDYYGIRDNVLIRVKRSNEVSDFTEWSALFAPTGYRHIGFCAKMVAGDKIGKVCSEGLGMTLRGFTWDLEYDKDESILKIRADQRGSRNFGGDPFPKDRLNEKAKQLGLLPE